jgi:hypothetical protein
MRHALGRIFGLYGLQYPQESFEQCFCHQHRWKYHPIKIGYAKGKFQGGGFGTLGTVPYLFL